MTDSVHLDIVSLKAPIFSGEVQMLAAVGELGDLGIYPGHTPLLTPLKPGPVKVIDSQGDEQVFYVSGGMLEVQPYLVTVLADAAVRADDLDEAAAIEARKQAEQLLRGQKTEMEFSTVLSELAETAAQLRTIQTIRKRAKR